MPFLFTNAVFLAALAGLGIPVALHLLMKRRQVRMRFSTVRFFQQQEPQAKARRKLRNLLLLLLRLLAFAMVVLAFTRPFLNRNQPSPGQRQRREVVLVVDRSLSLQARDSAGSRWENARAAAARVVAGLSGEDRVALVSCAARAEVLTGFAPPSVAAARLAALQPAHSTGDLAEGLREALRLAASGDPAARQSVTVVGDLQREGAANLDATPVPPRLQVDFVGVGDLLAPNLSVSELQFDVGETNHPYATVTSHRDDAVAGVEVEFLVDGAPVWRRPVALAAGAATNFDLRPPRLAPGWHQAEVRLATPDALAADNRRVAAFHVPEPVRVLAVEGRRGVRSFLEQSFFVAAALDPALGTADAGSGGFVVAKASPEQAAVRLRPLATPGAPGTRTARGPADKATADDPAHVVVMAAQRQTGAELAAALAAFVRSGGGLMLFLGEDTGSTDANALLSDLLPARIGRVEKGEPGNPWRLGEVDHNAPAFLPFRQPGSGNLALPEFTVRHALEPVPGAAVLARFDDGTPMLVLRAVGRGRVLLANTSADTRWTDWPKHKTFVPWLHGAVRQLSGRADERLLAGGDAVVTGTEAAVDLGPASKDTAFAVLPPTGPEFSATADARGVLRFDAALPGIHRVRDDAGVEVRQVAANVPARESDLASLRPSELAQRLVRREEAKPTGMAAALFGGDRNREEYWRILLAGAIALLLVETVVSNRSTA